MQLTGSTSSQIFNTAVPTALSIVTAGIPFSITTSGVPFANTAAVIAGSSINTVSRNIVSGGESNLEVAYGFGSYNFSTNEFGYLGKAGNSGLENLGYGLGAMANVGDVLAGMNPGSVKLRTENDPEYNSMGTGKDLIGHSQLTDMNDNPLVDWGPERGYQVTGLGDWVPGTNAYEQGFPISASKMKWDPITVKGVNASVMSHII